MTIRHFIRGVLLGLTLLLPHAAGAGAPSQNASAGDLLLRIETGKHTHAVRGLSISADGLLVTGGDDKTLRFWNPLTGTPTRTIRMPLAAGNEGMVRAVALSPNGKTLLATGETGPTWNGAGKYSIDLFDLDSDSAALKRLPGLPTVVNSMAFDNQGQHFYAGFANGVGVGMWKISGGFVKSDKQFKGDVTAIDVSADNRVAAAAVDGTVRLYDQALNTLSSVTLKAVPTGVAFSPDGGIIAVGTTNAGVFLLSADGLTVLRQLKAPAGLTGELGVVAWARMDRGVHLLASGTANWSEREVAIVGWKDMGFGGSYAVPASTDRIIGIRGLPQGGAAFVGAAPVVGRLSGDGRIAFAHAGDKAEFRDVFQGRFGISDDGLSVDFGVSFGGANPLRLTLRRSGGVLEPAEGLAPLASPRRSSPTLPLDGWWNGKQPKLGKRLLEMPGEELAHSVAVLPDNNSFLLGTDNTLRLYNQKGDLITSVSTPATVWGVVPAAAAPLAVAALGDGTLRWYSLRRENLLEELAAVFVHPDGRRWIAWTPEGAFAQSDSGGNDLVGYAKNDGEKRQPEWISFSQLFHAFHKPALVYGSLTDRASTLPELQRVAQAADPAKAPPPQATFVAVCYKIPLIEGTRSARRAPDAENNTAAAATPGEETCLSAQDVRTRSARRVAGDNAAAPTASPGQIALPDGVKTVQVRFRVDIPAGQTARDVEIFVNGANAGLATTRSARRVAGGEPPSQTVAGTGDAAGNGNVIEAMREISVSPGDNAIEVRAYSNTNLYGTTEVGVSLPEQPKASRGERRPTMYIVAMAINDYTPVGIGSLSLAIPDARAFVAKTREGAASLYGDVVVRELYDADMVGPKARAVFAEIAAKAQEDDAVLIYIAGHGMNLRVGDRDSYAFISYDTRVTAWERDPATGGEVAAAISSGITGEVLANELLSGIRSRRMMIVLDTCHSGAFDASFDIAKTVGHDLGNARIMVAAASSFQLALDGAVDDNGRRVNNGVFAYTALKGLGGMARQAGDDTVTAGDLISYVQKNVPKNAERVSPGHGQHPFAHHASNMSFQLSSVPSSADPKK